MSISTEADSTLSSKNRAERETHSLERQRRLREQDLARAALEALQQNDRTHPTLARAFTSDQLARLHARECFAARLAWTQGLAVIDAVYGPEHQPDPADAQAVTSAKAGIAGIRAVWRDAQDEQAAIRKLITDAKRAPDPGLRPKRRHLGLGRSNPSAPTV